jgi:allantoinase
MVTGEWTLRSRRVVTPSGLRSADILIRNETIAQLREYDAPDTEGVILDAGDLVVLPGLVALHRDGPDRPDRYGFEAATRDAAAGGVTTLVDLPSDQSLESDSPAEFEARLVAAEGKIRVDCGLIVRLGNGSSSQILAWIESGVIGIEASLGRGSEGSKAHSSTSDLSAAMRILAKLDRPLLVRPHGVGPPRQRPAAGESHGSKLLDQEIDSLRSLIRLCRESRCHVHLIHPTAPEFLPIIAEARAEELPLTVETCPYHLGRAPEEAAEGVPGFSFDHATSQPAIRDLLWDGLRAGLIDAIGTDHRPSFRPFDNSSEGEVRSARHGFTSLRLTLPALWTEARERGFNLEDVSRWMAANSARAFGLSSRKGSIHPGLDADLVVFDPEVRSSADPNPLQERHSAPAVQDRILTGQVEATILRGTLIYQGGQFHEHATGSVVLRLQETLPLHGTP